jgi:hypothetical protein
VIKKVANSLQLNEGKERTAEEALEGECALNCEMLRLMPKILSS